MPPAEPVAAPAADADLIAAWQGGDERAAAELVRRHARALGASFLPKDIYLISRMPSDPQSADILPIAIISLVLAFLATIYPSWRASRVNPAEALRYE